MEDDSWFQLPLIPLERGEVELGNIYKCLGLDGNVYPLGVQERKSGGIVDTYVFDLAGQRHWRKCAPMGTGGYPYLCEYEVLDGKIYSLGGLGPNSSLTSRGLNNVYDPVENTWTPIKPMRSLRIGHCVRAITRDEFRV